MQTVVRFTQTQEKGNIADKGYESSKYLYKTIKLKNLSDLGNAYNYQYFSILRRKIEKIFEFFPRRYGFNPRLCNLVSSLNRYIERQKWRIILALPEKGEIVQMNEKQK